MALPSRHSRQPIPAQTLVGVAHAYPSDAIATLTSMLIKEANVDTGGRSRGRTCGLSLVSRRGPVCSGVSWAVDLRGIG
jgi:hypothetical protein